LRLKRASEQKLHEKHLHREYRSTSAIQNAIIKLGKGLAELVLAVSIRSKLVQIQTGWYSSWNSSQPLKTDQFCKHSAKQP